MRSLHNSSGHRQQAGNAGKNSFVGTLLLREKRSGTKFKSLRTALSLSAGVFQGPSQELLSGIARLLSVA